MTPTTSALDRQWGQRGIPHRLVRATAATLIMNKNRTEVAEGTGETLYYMLAIRFAYLM